MINIVRLISGEELLAETKQVDNGYKLYDAAIIIPSEKGVALMPFMPYSTVDKELFLKNEAVLFVTEPTDEFRNYYENQTGRVVTPAQQIVV